MQKTKVLYISYDGANDPLGKSQVLPYLKNLSTYYKIFLISFEKAPFRNTGWKGIEWIPLSFHKGGVLAKIWDMVCGLWQAFWTVNKNRIKIIHSRGYFPAFIALCLKTVLGVRYIFDMRGFWVDEKVDGGSLKKQGILYIVAKRIEKKFLKSADEIVVLTEAMKNNLENMSYLKGKSSHIHVIRTCADLALFSPAVNKEIPGKLKNGFIVSYFGSIGTFYNFSAILDFYKILSKSINNARLLVMSNGPLDEARKMILGKEIKENDFYLSRMPYEEVPSWLGISDASIIFYRRQYSKDGCCPTKFGESLACGVPVIINDGIGDCSDIVKQKRVGVIVKNFTEDSYEEAIQGLSFLLKDKESLVLRCRETAEKLFSLGKGVDKYSNIYNSLK